MLKSEGRLCLSHSKSNANNLVIHLPTGQTQTTTRSTDGMKYDNVFPQTVIIHQTHSFSTPRILRARCRSLLWIVCRRAWMAQRLLPSQIRTRRTTTQKRVRVLEQANKIRLSCFLESKKSITPPAYTTRHKLHSSVSTNIMKRLLLQQKLG
jgi:hypothetical protein